MSISLNVPPKSEVQEKAAEPVIVELPKIVTDNEEDSMSRNDESSAGSASNPNSSIEFPAFLKKENMRKERVYVSKGSVITQYEDDMDVPTFLRKQMQ